MTTTGFDQASEVSLVGRWKPGFVIRSAKRSGRVELVFPWSRGRVAVLQGWPALVLAELVLVSGFVYVFLLGLFAGRVVP